MTEYVEVENVIRPGSKRRVEARKYREMRRAMLANVSEARPGLTVAELSARIVPALSAAVFPGGATAGWWFKCVQLDLEAKKMIARETGAPVRLYRCSG